MAEHVITCPNCGHVGDIDDFDAIQAVGTFATYKPGEVTFEELEPEEGVVFCQQCGQQFNAAAHSRLQGQLFNPDVP